MQLQKNIGPIVTCIITSSLIRLLSLLDGKKHPMAARLAKSTQLFYVVKVSQI